MAAYEQPLLFLSQTAGQDFTLNDRYSLVGATAEGVKTPTGTEPIVGVLYSMSAKGTAVKVMNKGIAIVQVGAGGIKRGDKVKAAGAKAVKAATEADVVIGIAQEDASENALGAILLTI